MFLVHRQTSHMAYISTMRASIEALVERNSLNYTVIQKTDPELQHRCKCVV